MGSQPPILSGSDCVKLGLIAIKGSVPLPVPIVPKESAEKVCQLDSEVQEKSSTSSRVTPPTTLHDSSARKPHPAELSGHVYPVARSLGDETEVHSTAAVETKVKPVESKQCENSVPRVPVPWGQLSKAIVLDVFKDVHTGLGPLGSPLQLSMNPSVTPVQAHPHRCPVAKEAKVAEAIRDLEKQGILQNVTEPTAWISNSVYREKPDGSIRVCIDPSQTINKAIEVPKYPIPTVDELLP